MMSFIIMVIEHFENILRRYFEEKYVEKRHQLWFNFLLRAIITFFGFNKRARKYGTKKILSITKRRDPIEIKWFFFFFNITLYIIY